MANHAGSLSAISFLGNQRVSPPAQRPSNNLVALNHAVLETHLLEIDSDSSSGDSHGIGRHHQARWAGFQLISDEHGTLAADWHQSCALQTVRPLLARGRRGRWQSQGKRRLRFKPFIERLLRVRANIKRKTSLSMLPVSANGQFGKLRPREWRG